MDLRLPAVGYSVSSLTFRPGLSYRRTFIPRPLPKIGPKN